MSDYTNVVVKVLGVVPEPALAQRFKPRVSLFGLPVKLVSELLGRSQPGGGENTDTE